MLVDGQLSIHHTIYKTSEYLAPDWLSPKHPNLTCDNGLLVVIEGEHCSKYVRQLHHEYNNGKITMILAVMKRTAGAVDILGEQLKLDAGYLYVGTETKEERNQNDSVMQAHKMHAK